MSKRAVLLVNLGSPDSTAVPDVRRYLSEFLGDERVIDKPPMPFRWLLVNGIIAPFRAPKSAHAYKSVWTPEGSPLLATSRMVRAKLEETLGGSPPVALAMRYGKPSIAAVVGELKAAGFREILLIPQYPHYAMSSWETVVAKVYEEFGRQAPEIRVTSLLPFYKDADYVEALYSSASPYLQKDFDLLLFSFHGIPIRHLRKADSSRAHCTCVPDCCNTPSAAHATCYKAQCLASVKAFAERAGLSAGRYAVTFQSRLGGEPWLSPYTDETLKALPGRGVKKLLVITPAFVADCLETLEEIRIEGRELFLEAGGESFDHIPCLNDQKPYIDFLAGRVRAWTS